jgi:hypothetical protein
MTSLDTGLASHIDVDGRVALPAEWKATVNNAARLPGVRLNVEVGLAVFVIAVKGYLRGYREEHLVSSYTTRKMRTAPVETFKATRPASTTTKGQT